MASTAMEGSKLIGARYCHSEGQYDVSDFRSPRDSIGHGTHTASIAAGREVPGASYMGLAEGVARGGVPSSRIAVYKVCWYLVCPLAAFDDAIADGVDIISVSLGSRIKKAYFEDALAIGSFHAMKNRILTAYSAGNSAPPAGEYAEGTGILIASGLGTIMVDPTLIDTASNYPLPATAISAEDVLKVLDYIRTSDKPIATIMVGEARKEGYCCFLFFQRTKPYHPRHSQGVDILAAWSPAASPTYNKDVDTRSFKYNVISGTSMSCPHASGAAAYIKAAHPNWSPAAIKSALMTTDYMNLLCKQGYNTSTLRLVTGDANVCNNTNIERAWDLNYPSFSLYVEDGEQIKGVFTRKVMNVGAPNSTYTSSMYMPTIIIVTVEPSVLSFSSIGETKSFTVKVTGPSIAQQRIKSGAIIWEDGVPVVRTPLVVYNYFPGARINLDNN
ncbi:hypothetical protein RJ639_003761 [Escallonia herrerae]|uniref:Cucumisin n=1 Tax=Escallonia herrerae TaxID=1293975 RepID=A0AA88W5J7_9ASTE|nr:hypothetical protein RJ639_003761 [Escallonia herrerae]